MTILDVSERKKTVFDLFFHVGRARDAYPRMAPVASLDTIVWFIPTVPPLRAKHLLASHNGDIHHPPEVLHHNKLYIVIS